MVSKTFFGCVCCCGKVSDVERVDVDDVSSNSPPLSRNHFIHKCNLVDVRATSLVLNGGLFGPRDRAQVKFEARCMVCKSSMGSYESVRESVQCGDDERTLQCGTCLNKVLVQASHCRHFVSKYFLGGDVTTVGDDLIHLNCIGVGYKGNSYNLSDSAKTFLQTLQRRPVRHPYLVVERYDASYDEEARRFELNQKKGDERRLQQMLDGGLPMMAPRELMLDGVRF